MFMAVTAFLAIVGDFEAYIIGVGEECRPIVRRVLGVELSLRSFDACASELFRNRNDISY